MTQQEANDKCIAFFRTMMESPEAMAFKQELAQGGYIFQVALAYELWLATVPPVMVAAQGIAPSDSRQEMAPAAHDHECPACEPGGNMSQCKDPECKALTKYRFCVKHKTRLN